MSMTGAAMIGTHNASIENYNRQKSRECDILAKKFFLKHVVDRDALELEFTQSLCFTSFGSRKKKLNIVGTCSVCARYQGL